MSVMFETIATAITGDLFIRAFLSAIVVITAGLSVRLGVDALLAQKLAREATRMFSRHTRNTRPARLTLLWWQELLRAYPRIPFSARAQQILSTIAHNRDRDEVIAQLPHMIDIITLSVGAGLPFDQSLETYVNANGGVLAHHFGLALKYWQTGIKLRAEALDDVAADLGSREIERFVSALKQSLVLGTALVYVLEAQGNEARDAHKQYLETRIAKTPVKMLIPMATCVIPSLLILLLGPVVIDVLSGLGSGI